MHTTTSNMLYNPSQGMLFFDNFFLFQMTLKLKDDFEHTQQSIDKLPTITKTLIQDIYILNPK